MSVKKFIFIVVSSLLLSGMVDGYNKKRLRKNDTHNKLTTSLIVPCCPKHAPRLFELLKIYENQTLLSDEVVISLSESNLVQAEVLDALQNELWSFPILLILSQEKLYAGQNRNRACEHAQGDIFICQDADDIPHPQRIEIIKYFFDHYKVDHLIHQFIFGSPTQDLIIDKYYYTCIEQLLFFYNEEISDAWRKRVPLCPGNPAVARHVFEKIQWSDMPRGQDVEFNEKVYAQFDNCFAVRVPLLVYRQFLSSTNKEEVPFLPIISFKGIQDENRKKQYKLTIKHFE